jgi:hypothetical protein
MVVENCKQLFYPIQTSMWKKGYMLWNCNPRRWIYEAFNFYRAVKRSCFIAFHGELFSVSTFLSASCGYSLLFKTLRLGEVPHDKSPGDDITDP